MAIEVFKRFEKKYILDEHTMMQLQGRFAGLMEPDEYNIGQETYHIVNLYYDTAGSDIIRMSLSKPEYKEKLRLRGYGAPSADSKVYLEIKKKVRGVVNKRRSGMTLDEAYAFLANGELPVFKPHMNQQVLKEIAYMLERKPLIPAICLSYDRRAFFGKEQRDLRISFDTNVLTRRTDLGLEYGSYGNPLLPDGKWLMEIKVSTSIPLWVSRLLSELRIYPVGFSKYGTEYKKSLQMGA